MGFELLCFLFYFIFKFQVGLRHSEVKGDTLQDQHSDSRSNRRKRNDTDTHSYERETNERHSMRTGTGRRLHV
ncbi:hypothetical protein K439DRAFT_1632470 [Ramaria rubella]|nr:hypothetical protein K439DRAFT_1632470 [Ramaria rubella]